jgi:hypothetical protein
MFSDWQGFCFTRQLSWMLVQERSLVMLFPVIKDWSHAGSLENGDITHKTRNWGDQSLVFQLHLSKFPTASSEELH